MRVSVVCADSTISVDGVGRVCAFDLPEGVRAIQWDGSVGYFEKRRSAGGGLEFFEDVSVVAPYIAAWSNAPADAMQVAVPGIPEKEEWLEGTMPGGRDVKFTELTDYEIPPDVPQPPPPEPLHVSGDTSGSGADAGVVDAGEDVIEAEAVEVATDHGGVMVSVDQRKSDLSVIVGDMALDRAEASEDVIRNTDEGELNHLLEMDLITDEQREQLTALYAAKARCQAIYGFALKLQRAIRDMDGDALEAFDPADAEWPA